MSGPDGGAARIVLLVNGAEQVLPEGTSVADLVRALGRDPSVPGVAVAVEGDVVRRAEWAEAILYDGDRVEVLTAVQGGV